MNKFDLLKSHVAAYTKKDGTVVAAHETAYQKHQELEKKTRAAAARAKSASEIAKLRPTQENHAEAARIHGQVSKYAGKLAGNLESNNDLGSPEDFELYSGGHASHAKKAAYHKMVADRPAPIHSAISTLTPHGEHEWSHSEGSSKITVGAHRALDSFDVLGDQGWQYVNDNEMSHPDGHRATIDDGTLTLHHAPLKKSEDSALDLIKSHVDAYTKKDGTVVQAHDDKRVAAQPMSHDQWADKVKSTHGSVTFKKDAKAGVVHAFSGTNPVGSHRFAQGGKPSTSHISDAKAPPIATHAAALAASSKPGDLDHEDNQYAADLMEKGDHKALASHLKGLDTAARDHILDHVHPDHWSGLGFDPLNKEKSVAAHDKRFDSKTIAANAAEKASTAKKDAARKGAKDVTHKVGDKVHNVYHDFGGTVAGHTPQGHPVVKDESGFMHAADNHKEWQPAKSSSAPPAKKTAAAPKKMTFEGVLATPDGRSDVDAIEDLQSSIKDKGGAGNDPHLDAALEHAHKAFEKKYGFSIKQ